MSVKYNSLWLLFFLSGVLLAEENDIPEFLKFDTTLYGQRNNGYKTNTLDYSNNGPSTCLSNHVGKNSDNENRESCDFWWHNYSGNKTHTGADFQVSASNNLHKNVYSFSFGRVCKSFNGGSQHTTTSSYVSIDYLLDSGESVTASYLHFEEGQVNSRLLIDGSTYEQNVSCENSHIAYVTKKGLLGKEGNTGLSVPSGGGGGCVASGSEEAHNHISNCRAHLHLEFSDMAGGSHFVPTSHACTGDSCPDSRRYSSRDLDGLSAYYEFNNAASSAGTTEITPLPGQQVWYNPDSVFKQRKVLLPVVYHSSKLGDFKKLYGYKGEDVVTRLYLNRSEQKQFDNVSLLYERQISRDIARYFAPNDFNVAISEKVIPSGNTVESNNITIRESGDYLFVAYVKDGDKKLKGYPVIYSVLNPSQFIIDNDQLNNNSSSNIRGQESFSINGKSEKIPGYYLTADDLLDGSKAIWRPNRRGRFTIQMFVPENINPSIQDYSICSGTNKCIPVFNELNQPVTSETDFRWLNVTTDSISLDLSASIVAVGDNDPNTTILADAIKFSYNGADIELIKSYLDIPNNSLGAHKIVKHYMEFDVSSMIKTSDGDIHASFVVEGEDEYAVYQLGKKAVSINIETHRITFRNCSVSTKWPTLFNSFLGKIGIGSCEEKKDVE